MSGLEFAVVVSLVAFDFIYFLSAECMAFENCGTVTRKEEINHYCSGAPTHCFYMRELHPRTKAFARRHTAWAFAVGLLAAEVVDARALVFDVGHIYSASSIEQRYHDVTSNSHVSAHQPLTRS